MVQWFRVVAANLLWFCYVTIQARRWKRATRDVAGAQQRVLKRILARNANCAFGQEHKFVSLQSVEAYQQQVALRSYEAFELYIRRIADMRLVMWWMAKPGKENGSVGKMEHLIQDVLETKLFPSIFFYE